MEKLGWWDNVESKIGQWSLLNHPFNVAWREGKLALGDIQLYAKQYYRHVDYFPRYVSAVHSNTSDLKTRQMLLENLNEEERGNSNHPELWLRFCEGAGLKREDVLSSEPLKQTTDCIETFMSLAKNSDNLSGMAALYAYESQLPELSAVKVQRLDVHYGIIDQAAYEFFKVHETADVWHSKVEKEAIINSAHTDDSKELVTRSVETACRAVWGMFDGISKARGLL